MFTQKIFTPTTFHHLPIKWLRRGSNETGAAFSELSQDWRDNSEGPVLSDLLKDVPRFPSVEPKQILKFFVDIKATYDLKLVPDNVFWMRLLPKLRGSLLTFLWESMRYGDSWEQCKALVLKKYFPLFVSEMMIR
jgi:hypothetical protein